jgi:mono/diheme cytochrome c family protein
MFNSTKRKAVLLIALVSSSITSGMSQTPSQNKAGKAPVELSGKEMFKYYCAACHGEDAKGHGPVAPALKVPPPDLTALSKGNSGKFPEEHFVSVLKNGANAPTHGTADMPIWGPIFSVLNAQRLVNLRISNLTRYLESIQQK